MNRRLMLCTAVALALTCAPAVAVAAPGGSTPSRSVTSVTAAHPLLRLGDRGPAVRRVQRRLASLGYWLGRADGVFGDSTQQAVYAIQKAAGISRDGVVGRQTRAALRAAVTPTARSRSGHVVEINLRTDLLMLVDNGVVTTTLNTSTGGGFVYVSNGVAAVARTPVGHFRIYQQIDGMHISPLGVMWRPKYFSGGYAIHGSPSVPPTPASHGCVRLSNAAINWIWADGLMPLGTPVWVYY